jgi:hypothetical protein
MIISGCQFIDVNNYGNGGSMYLNNIRNVIIEQSTFFNTI